MLITIVLLLEPMAKTITKVRLEQMRKQKGKATEKSMVLRAIGNTKNRER